MRIWSVHPKYLDSKGLVAVWRETLLAGKTRGYKNHPQLTRFRNSDNPVERIDQYLAGVFEEAFERGYFFDKKKINMNYVPAKIPVTDGQLAYETQHLLSKLKIRDPEKYSGLSGDNIFEPHPLFEVVHGSIESWEKTDSGPFSIL